jgi:hypothetical protein
MVSSSWLHHFKQISAGTVTVTALAVVLGVLLGFLAARVWANFDRAIPPRRTGSRRADGNHDLFAETFPPEIKGRVRDAVLGHVKSAVEDEWPTMARREGIAAVPPPSLRERSPRFSVSTPPDLERSSLKKVPSPPWSRRSRPGAAG